MWLLLAKIGLQILRRPAPSGRRPWRSGERPDIAVDGDRLYVVNSNSDDISVVDTVKM